MPRKTEKATPQANLTAAIKSARDIMRKDAGLSGETDRIPQLAWHLFLKAFDDLERKREIQQPEFRPAIECPNRWSDWAAAPVDGRTEADLIAFANPEQLPYMRNLKRTGRRDPRDV